MGELHYYSVVRHIRYTLYLEAFTTLNLSLQDDIVKFCLD